MKLLLYLVLLIPSIAYSFITEGHLTILNDDGTHRIALVSLYSLTNLGTPLKQANSYSYNSYGWPNNANFAFDTGADWDPNAQWTYPNHVLPGTYRLRIDNKYVEMTIVQEGSGDFSIKYQFQQFTVIHITQPQYVQISETRDWDIPITFEQKAANGIDNIGEVAARVNGQFEKHLPPYDYYLIPNNYHYFHADTNVINSQKYNNWSGDLSVINYSEVYILDQPEVIQSNFKLVSQSVIVKNNLEQTGISSGTIKFIDPWVTEELAIYGRRNKGSNATLITVSSPFNPNINGNTTEKWFKGVFLNQDPTFDPTIPNYSIESPTYQDINLGGIYGVRRFYFQKWSGSNVQFQNNNALQTGVVITDVNAEVNANLKGHFLTSETTGFNSNSQRKIVRDNNGIYHCVYTSMGSLWYTKSTTTNFGGTWTQEIEVAPATVKNPSIDILNNEIALVFEYSFNGDYDVVLYIWNITTGDPRFPHIFDLSFGDITSSYFGQAYPVVSFTQKTSDNSKEMVVVYKPASTSAFKYSRMYFQNGVEVLNKHQENVTLPGTTSTCSNPSIAGVKVSNDHSVHIVYEKEGKYINYIYTYSNPSLNRIFNSPVNITSGGPLQWNYKPSVSLYSTTSAKYPIVSWTGHNDPALGKITGTESANTPKIVSRPKTSSSWGAFFSSGDMVDFTNNNSTTSTSGETVIVWSENGGSDNKYVKRVNGSYQPFSCIDEDGVQLNLSNGTSFSNLKVGILNNLGSAPFVLTKSSKDFSTQGNCGIGKITNSFPVIFGRGGIVSIGDVNFIFNTGDIIADDSVIQFIDVPDTIIYQSPEEINLAVGTNPFELDQNSTLYFSNLYYVLNSDIADSVLNDNDAVSFRVELKNFITDNVVGTFDNITLNRENLAGYENISYEVDCSGIQEGEYYLRLVIEVIGEAEYNLVNIQNDGAIIQKKLYNSISYNGTAIPESYDLTQNYPNPFNPSTTIKYQIPEDGMVKMKIYDILGKEVKTLVNEQKSSGRYEVKFDASDLASGVYIYRIQVNDYISAKKMVLLK